MNKHATKTISKAKGMTLDQAKTLLHHHDTLRGADRLRWLGCGTDRYDVNLGVLEAAREIVEANEGTNP